MLLANHVVDFWQMHGWLFIIAIAFFPRLTMLLGTAGSALVGPQLFWAYWLGWLFAPHVTAAVIGTWLYWDTNPTICVLAWIVALAGETTEKKVLRSASSGNDGS